MKQENKMEEINSKRRVFVLLGILSFFMAILFTLVGSIAYIYLMMFLVENFNISFFTCGVLIFTLPSFYSYMVKPLINYIDNKRNCILSEISFLEEEYDREMEDSFQKLNESLGRRFDKLSRERQLKLLNFIKGDLSFDTEDLKIENLNHDEMLKLMEELNKVEDNCSLECVGHGYSRRRVIDDEIDK